MASNELQDTLDRILLEKNVKLIPENIKKGVTIFGVTGNATIDMTDALSFLYIYSPLFCFYIPVILNTNLTLKSESYL